MRQIKFRAWDKRTCKMFPVASVHFGDDGSALTITADLAPKEHAYSTIDKLIIHGESGVLMQFTGLQDRTGKDVYEGDIVEMFERSLFRVVWNDYYARYQLELVKGDELTKVHAPDQFQFSVIVGNIYEHPNLLAKEQ